MRLARLTALVISTRYAVIIAMLRGVLLMSSPPPGSQVRKGRARCAPLVQSVDLAYSTMSLVVVVEVSVASLRR